MHETDLDAEPQRHASFPRRLIASIPSGMRQCHLSILAVVVVANILLLFGFLSLPEQGNFLLHFRFSHASNSTSTLSTPIPAAENRTQPTPAPKPEPPLFEAARNETLGFERIFYISLPSRTDRQDAMELMSSFSGIHMTQIDGVDGGKMSEKAKPPGTTLLAAALGCWRAHANTWRQMIAEDIETAMILEDDADWDKDVKDEFYRISKAMSQGTPMYDKKAGPRHGAPYGTDWDIMYLGSCWANPDFGSTPGPVVKVEDPSVSPFEKLRDSWKISLSHYGAQEGYRTVTRAYDTLCTTGYALTKRGAQKLLYNFGYKSMKNPIDNEIATAIKDGRLQGIITTPPMVVQFKTNTPKDTDITDKPLDKPIAAFDIEKGRSPDLKNSVRKEMKKLFSSEPPKSRQRRRRSVSTMT